MAWIKNPEFYEWKNKFGPYTMPDGRTGILTKNECGKCHQEPEYLWACDVCDGYERESGYLCEPCLLKIVSEKPIQ